MKIDDNRDSEVVARITKLVTIDNSFKPALYYVFLKIQNICILLCIYVGSVSQSVYNLFE